MVYQKKDMIIILNVKIDLFSIFFRMFTFVSLILILFAVHLLAFIKSFTFKHINMYFCEILL